MLTKARSLGITEFPYREYNKKGKISYYEREDGYWWRAEYHSSGFETFIEFSNGLFLKRKFDKKGRQLYCETACGVLQDDRNLIKKAGRTKKSKL